MVGDSVKNDIVACDKGHCQNKGKEEELKMWHR